ncbi:MAG: hypothetical protein JOY66_03335 [Acetobacteraceae bacterium]|nr:hypothetical protein [Acetobacteraceae bacterium]
MRRQDATLRAKAGGDAAGHARDVRGVAERLLAPYCAVSTGLWDRANHPLPAEVRPARKRPKKVARSLASSFTRGLRRIASLLQAALPMPALWAASG